MTDDLTTLRTALGIIDNTARGSDTDDTSDILAALDQANVALYQLEQHTADADRNRLTVQVEQLRTENARLDTALIEAARDTDPDDEPDDGEPTRAALIETIAAADADRDRLEAERDQARTERDAVYRERAHLVAYLAAAADHAVLVEQAPDAPDWSIVYIYAGPWQLSWHIAPADRSLFRRVQVVPADDPRAAWDGHSTDRKYRRLRCHTRIQHLNRQLGAPVDPVAPASGG